MLDKLIGLIEVRRIIALITIIVFTILALKGELDSDFIKSIVTVVITFYFAKETALDKNNQEECDIKTDNYEGKWLI